MIWRDADMGTEFLMSAVHGEKVAVLEVVVDSPEAGQSSAAWGGELTTSVGVDEIGYQRLKDREENCDADEGWRGISKCCT